MHYDWLRDDPLEKMNEESDLGRAPFVDSVVSLLERVREQGESSIMGLIGPWGSGKTSVLNEIKRRLTTAEPSSAQEPANWLVATFNPWMFTDAPSLHSGFFAELRSALPEGKRWNNTRDTVLVWSKRVAPLSALAGLVGIDGQGAVKDLIGQFETGISEQHKRVSEALKELDSPILMIVDDLDRLTADELLQVFKLVRLVGRLPNVYYLLSYDEQTLIDILGKTDLVRAGNDRRALDYLEKIVQVRIDLPLLRLYQVDQIVDDSLRRLVEDHGLSLSEGELASILRLFDGVLSTRLRTPRAIKRYFGQVDAFLGALRQEVNLGDFLLLTWLRTMEPGVYALIQANRKELLGEEGTTLRSLHRPRQSGKEKRDEWEKILKESRVGPTDVDDILYLLNVLFPAFAHIYRREEASTRPTYPSEADALRLANGDYFDRYFSFGVPEEDVSDADMRAALSSLSLAPSSQSVSALDQAYQKQPHLVLRKLQRHVGADVFEPKSVVRWLLTKHSTVYDAESSVRERLHALSALSIMQLEINEAVELIEELAETDSGLVLASSVRQLLNVQSQGDARVLEKQHALAQAMTPPLVERLEKQIRIHLLDTKSAFDLSKETETLIDWLGATDETALRKLLQAQLTSGAWDLLDTLAWFVPVRTNRSVEEISPWGEPFIQKVLPISEALSLIDSGAIKSAGNIADLYRAPATRENRRAFVLGNLASASIGEPPVEEPDRGSSTESA